MVPIAIALVDAAPDRMIWGTDWSHVMPKKQMTNDGDLCDLLADWIPDPDRRNQVLVDNPANYMDSTKPYILARLAAACSDSFKLGPSIP